MTNFEKAEFERRKTQAEKQLNEMYYGASKNAKNFGNMKPASSFNNEQKNHSAKQNTGQNPHKSNNQEKQTNGAKADNIIQNQHSKGLSLLNMLNFKNLKMDNDRLIILALCLLLSSEETDELLLMALMYIML